MALPYLSPSVQETASHEAETGADVSGGLKKRVVVCLHARLFVQAVDIGVWEIEVQLLAGAAFTEAAHRGGHRFDLFIVIHRTDVHVGLHPLKGRPDGIEARGKGAVRSLSGPCGLLGWGRYSGMFPTLQDQKVGYILSMSSDPTITRNFLCKLEVCEMAKKTNHFRLDSQVESCLF